MDEEEKEPVIKEISEAEFEIEGEEGSYKIPIRSFEIHLSELAIGHSYSGRGKYSTDSLKRHLSGEAIIGDAGLTIAGEEELRTNKLSVRIECEDDYPSTEDELLNIKEEKTKQEDTENWGSASLGFLEGDWEIGNGDQFWCELGIKEKEFDLLFNLIRNGNMAGLTVYLDGIELYVQHFHAPPSFPVTWYFKPEKYGPMVNGRISAFFIGEKPLKFELKDHHLKRVRWVRSEYDDDNNDEIDSSIQQPNATPEPNVVVQQVQSKPMRTWPIALGLWAVFIGLLINAAN